MSLVYDYDTVAPMVCVLADCSPDKTKATAIGWESDGQIVSGVLYEQFTGEGGSVTAHIAIQPGSRLVRAFLRDIFDYPFNRLKVGKVFAMIGSSNDASVRLVEHMGFVKEAVVPGYCPGEDLLVFGMSADNCKWIGEQNG